MHALRTLLVAGTAAFLITTTAFAQRPSNNPNDYRGSDSERIAAAVAAAPFWGGVVRVPPRTPDEEGSRDFWLLDSAILLPSHTTLLLESCTLKLSDAARDNLIRSANCGPGIERVAPLEDVRVVGIGNARLVGADRPRATGDSGKTLGVRTYGTDAGKADESQTGDWRNIGVLLANVRGFCIENLTIVDAHAWSVSLERCVDGAVRNLTFDAQETREIDGESAKALVANGCKLFFYSNPSRENKEDRMEIDFLIAKSKITSRHNISPIEVKSSSGFTTVSTIRNVTGYAAGGHQIVRLLNASGIKIYRVTIDGVMDASPEGVVDRATIRIGDANPAWGGVTPLGDTYGITIANVHSQARQGILIAGSLTDSTIMNVVNYNPEAQSVCYESGKENVRNVQITGVVDVKRGRE